MAPASAGILLFRQNPAKTQVLLVHPGGPFWKNKDLSAWSIPKGEIGAQEDPLEAAKREFKEELGMVPAGLFVPLAPIKQKGGKVVYAFACEGDFDPAMLKSNTFEIEWPPRSGRRTVFPEVDRAGWFPLDAAARKINSAQIPLLLELERRLNVGLV